MIPREIFMSALAPVPEGTTTGAQDAAQVESNAAPAQTAQEAGSFIRAIMTANNAQSQTRTDAGSVSDSTLATERSVIYDLELHKHAGTASASISKRLATATDSPTVGPTGD